MINAPLNLAPLAALGPTGQALMSRVLCAGFAFTALSGCIATDSGLPQVGPTVGTQSADPFTLVYSFQHGFLGSGPVYPTGALIVQDGVLYGLSKGGDSNQGTFYRAKLPVKNNVVATVYFTDAATGSTPTGSLGCCFTTKAGARYWTGAAYWGGAHHNGTFFRVINQSPGGPKNCDCFMLPRNEVYSFRGGPTDGANPNGSPTQFNGTFFGTTRAGGANDLGVVYGVDADGRGEHVVGWAAGGMDSPQHLYGKLVVWNDKLCGVSAEGGAYGGGAIFCVDSAATNAKLGVWYSFGGESDGKTPTSGLVRYDNAWWGTTRAGGAYGGGTIYRIDDSGNEQVVYSFGANSALTGTDPRAGLTAFGGALYGTTESGGAQGAGAIFAIASNRVFCVWHAFVPSTEGLDPAGDLTPVGGTLYGVLASGGQRGLGSIFSLTPNAGEPIRCLKASGFLAPE